MWLFLFFSIVFNIALIAMCIFLFRKASYLAEIIFVFEDNFPELMKAHSESLKAANSVIDNDYFMTSPEVGQKFKNLIDTSVKSKNATIQIIHLLEEIDKNIKTKVNVKLIEGNGTNV
jgi:hypothetical protein